MTRNHIQQQTGRTDWLKKSCKNEKIRKKGYVRIIFNSIGHKSQHFNISLKITLTVKYSNINLP